MRPVHVLALDPDKIAARSGDLYPDYSNWRVSSHIKGTRAN